jgi:thiol-disulfide isomerase/thioredoxin
MYRLRSPCTISGILLLCLFAAALWLPPRAVVADERAQLLDLDEYRGKVIVIDFWASWCVPCRRSFPWLDEMQSRYADDGLVVIGVNEDDVAEDAEAFLRSFPVGFRILADRDGELARRFDLLAMPSTYVIDRNGEVAVRHLGFRSSLKDEYEATLKRLLDPAVAANDDGS